MAGPYGADAVGSLSWTAVGPGLELQLDAFEKPDF